MRSPNAGRSSSTSSRNASSSSTRPALHFHLDHSVERGTKVMEIMRQIDEVTPSTPLADEDAPMSPRAAREAADMEAQEEATAARHQIEADGADQEQDALFEETFAPQPASDRGDRTTKRRAAQDQDPRR